jgi:signal peptidase I
MPAKPERRRKPFEIGKSKGASENNAGTKSVTADRPLVGPISAFFADYGVRETIESILVAVVLALLFRAFEAEAFIIPTGSMAPALQGQHMDVVCDKCKFPYRAGASDENSTVPVDERFFVTQTSCPICQYPMNMRRKTDSDHRSNQGDRILVNKFIYDFKKPDRFDVIVFKYPNNGKQNFIKRLVGLPGENLIIERGDIYLAELSPFGEWERKIVRKPEKKLLAMMQLVDDTDYIASELQKVNWPLRWQEWSKVGGESGWSDVTSSGKPSYTISKETSAQTHWLRYRHLIPEKDEWVEIAEQGKPQERANNDLGRWIGDYCVYNDVVTTRNRPNPLSYGIGGNFVGDLGVEALVDIDGSEGKLFLDVVEGGAHFQCEIELASGLATLSCSDPSVQFQNDSGQEVVNPTVKTKINGGGRYHLRYINADDEVRLWVNDQLFEFDAGKYTRTSPVYPTWSPVDAGDAEPLGIGAQAASMKIHRLQVFRDIYYVSISQSIRPSDDPGQETLVSHAVLKQISMSPRDWGTPRVHDILDQRLRSNKPMFQLKAEQFMPMGDNSPASSDARIWDGPPYVSEELLLGRAMFVYWPHSLNKPIPYFPNFKHMGPIR